LLEAICLDVELESAAGNYLTLRSGRKILDANSQYGAVPFGHNPPFIAAAIARHFSNDAPCMVQPFANTVTRELAEALSKLTDNQFDHVTFASTGAEAVEAALKMVKCKSSRPRVLATSSGFHGKTRGALSVTLDPMYCKPFVEDANMADAVLFGDVAALDARLQTEAYSAFILEPVQGEGGIVPAPSGYLAAVRELCSRYGTYLILDEIQTGFYRTGPCFVYQEAQITPDILLVGKALGGGALPMSACMARKTVWTETFCRKHSSTFSNNGVCASAALAVSRHVLELGPEIEAHVREMGALLLDGMRQLARRHPDIIEEARGTGLLLGLDFKPFSKAYFLEYLSNSGMHMPLVCSYIFNVHGIHFAPTLKKNRVLRIEPPLTIKVAEVASILSAIADVCELIERRGCSGLIDFLLSRMEVPNAA
jgi:acetylornithine/succinyldiaminopimelate/putrescine aminotransferase